MGDIQAKDTAKPVRIIGADIAGVEQTPVNSDTDGKVLSRDTANGGGLDTIITIAAGAVVELKIGGTTKTNRTYVMIQAKDTGITYGFSAVTQSFDAFKSQFFILPFGSNTSVFIKNNGGSPANVAIGEVT